MSDCRFGVSPVNYPDPDPEDMKCDSSGIAPLKKDGINYSEPTDQAEILDEQFVNSFTKEDCTSIPTT